MTIIKSFRFIFLSIELHTSKFKKLLQLNGIVEQKGKKGKYNLFGDKVIIFVCWGSGHQSASSFNKRAYEKGTKAATNELTGLHKFNL